MVLFLSFPPFLSCLFIDGYGHTALRKTTIMNNSGIQMIRMCTMLTLYEPSRQCKNISKMQNMTYIKTQNMCGLGEGSRVGNI
jgi:hypothetical protein